MTIEEYTERWLIQIERIICFLENEFFILNEKQLNYRLHVRRCSIREIMNHLYILNARLIPKLNDGIALAGPIEEKQEYAPGWPGRYFLSHTRFTRCIKPGRNKSLSSESTSGKFIFSGLLEQENELKDLISSSTRLDMNKKVVPFRLSGIIKLSLAETLEYIMQYQQSHFAQARHLLKIQ